MTRNSGKNTWFGMFRTDSGKIIGTSPSAVRVAINAPCPEAVSCSGCSACDRAPGVSRVEIPVLHPEEFCVGQDVRVRRFFMNQAAAAFLLFGVPVLGAFSAAAYATAAMKLGPESGLTVVVTLAGGAAGIIVCSACDRIIRRLHPPELETSVRE
jgi:hypothetical protein